MKKAYLLLLSLWFLAAAPVTVIAADKSNLPEPALNLIHALGCKGCHSINADGGSLAPDLTQVGSRLTADQINSHLRAHTETRTKGFMPSYSTLAPEELELISQYLYNLR